MATETLKLSYSVDTRTMAKAMAFAGAKLQRSPSPRLRRKQYLFFGVIVLLLIMMTNVAIFIFGLDVWNAGLVIGIIWTVLAMIQMQRVAIEGLAEAVTETAMKRGEIRLTVGPGGLSEQSGIGRMDIIWDVVEEIEGMAGSTVIRFGGMCFAVPDTALPDDLTPEAFRNRLISWRDATEVFG